MNKPRNSPFGRFNYALSLQGTAGAPGFSLNYCVNSAIDQPECRHLMRGAVESTAKEAGVSCKFAVGHGDG